MKYKYCGYLDNGIEFGSDKINLCNRCAHTGGGNLTVASYNDKKHYLFTFQIEDFIKFRNKIIEYFRQGKNYASCNGCMDLQEQDTPPYQNYKNKIGNIIFHHWTKCNSKCTYCYTNANKEYFNTRKAYKVYPILKEMEKKNYLETEGIANFAGGEISCLDEFEDIYKILKKYNYFIIFNSSAIKYEKSIEEYLKEEIGLLIVSIDAGYKETHRKIKQVDTFEKVWKNLKKYTCSTNDKSQIFAKYIFLQRINDNKDEIVEFLRKTKESGITQVIFDIDIYWLQEQREYIPEYIIELFYFAKQEANKLNLDVSIYDNATILFSETKYKNDFWKEFEFSNTYRTDARYRKILAINKENNITEYERINKITEEKNINFFNIKKACELAKKGVSTKINNIQYVYKKDFLLENSNEINFEKIKKLNNQTFLTKLINKIRF